MHPCSYCGLPTSVRPSPTTVEVPKNAEKVFCCLGCRIADGVMHRDEESDSQWTITRLGIAIFFTMNVMVFTLVLWTWNVHDISPDPRIEVFRGILRYACLLFSTPVLILLGGPLLESSLDAFQQKRFTTDVLLLLGVIAAYGYSLAALLFDAPDVYFEVCCMILVAVTLGKWLEGTAKQKATRAIRSLRELLPKTVRVLSASGEQIRPTDEANIGDRLRVLPGERVPLDGTVDGEPCIVDEQFITGESLPADKQVGDAIYAGSLNLARELVMTVLSPADSGTISRLVKAVEDATATECQSLRLADRLAAGFVPLIALASVITFAWHYESGIQHALMASVSVVLIACPCALGIATPMALWVAINSAAHRGVLFRNGDAVIQLAKLRSLGVDKTGTITSGRLRVTSEQLAVSVERELVRAIAVRLARSSNHPVSKALVAELCGDDGEDDALQLTQLEDHPGQGVSARALIGDSSQAVLLGSAEFARSRGLSLPTELEAFDREQQSLGQALVCVGWGQHVQAVYYLADTIREESNQTLNRLQKLGLSLVILTGDTRQRAAAMADATGVKAVGELLPEEKSQLLRTFPSPVGMVGDGLNDAVCLAKADVGIAMDCGADVTRESADVCLLGSTLKELPWAIELARGTQKTIRRNLFWAVGYNAVGIGFAVTGNLNPIVAAIAMVGSSFFVLANSLALGMTGNSQRPTPHEPSEGPRALLGEESESPNAELELAH